MRPGRRWRRRLVLRSKRVVARHYVSLVSAAVIAIALAVALTDASFDAHQGHDAATTATAAKLGSSAAASPRRPAPALETGTVIYYIVESARQLDVLHTVRRGETAYREYETAPLQPPTSVYYLVFDTPEQEAAGAKLLHQVAELAPLQGFNLTVIDLTQ